MCVCCLKANIVWEFCVVISLFGMTAIVLCHAIFAHTLLATKKLVKLHLVRTGGFTFLSRHIVEETEKQLPVLLCPVA